jgi:hypothetical protein
MTILLNPKRQSVDKIRTLLILKQMLHAVTAMLSKFKPASASQFCTQPSLNSEPRPRHGLWRKISIRFPCSRDFEMICARFAFAEFAAGFLKKPR